MKCIFIIRHGGSFQTGCSSLAAKRINVIGRRGAPQIQTDEPIKSIKIALL